METSTKVDSWIRSVQFQLGQTDQLDRDSFPLYLHLCLSLSLFLNIAHSQNSFPGYSTTARLHRILAHDNFGWFVSILLHLAESPILVSIDWRSQFTELPGNIRSSLISPYKNMIYCTDRSFRQLSASLTSFSRYIGKYIINNTICLSLLKLIRIKK